MRYVLPSAALLLALILPGCGRLSALQGNGQIKSETRPSGEFSRVEVSNAIHLDASIGEKASIDVTADDNLLPHLLTEVKDGTLTIRFDGSYSTKHGIKVKVVTPKLESLHGSGATRSTIGGLKQEKFSVELSGASNATINGEIKSLTAQCSGASRINAKDVPAETVHAEASGASTIEVSASKEIAGTASGASTVLYSGSPGKLTVNASGASSVRQAK